MAPTTRLFAFLVAALLAPAAGAITFTGPGFAYSSPGVTPVPGGEMAVADTPDGFVLTGDLMLGSGTQVIGARREFSVGPLPEQISVSASENWKIVLSGGGGQNVPGSLSVWTRFILSDPPAYGGSYSSGAILSQVGNGFGVVGESLHGLVFDSFFPANGILTPGDYEFQIYVETSWTPGTPASIFTEGAFIEFGGISSFTGYTVSVVGTPVPEPTSAGLLALGLLGLAARRRLR